MNGGNLPRSRQSELDMMRAAVSGQIFDHLLMHVAQMNVQEDCIKVRTAGESSGIGGIFNVKHKIHHVPWLQYRSGALLII